MKLRHKHQSLCTFIPYILNKMPTCISRGSVAGDLEQYSLFSCVDLKLGSSLLDFECHFNETIEKKMR
ncbi:hypothetical protein CsSME_00050910 [Camellia sinensis var. sinensis]